MKGETMKRCSLYAMAGIAFGAMILEGPATAAHAAEPGKPAATASLLMVHVRVRDFARSEQFYRDVFGMEMRMAPNPHEHVLNFRHTAPGTPGVILLLVGEDDVCAGSGGFLLQVADLDQTITRVSPAGGVVARAPRDAVAGIRNAFVKDPDGTTIELMQYVR